MTKTWTGKSLTQRVYANINKLSRDYFVPRPTSQTLNLIVDKDVMY